MRDAAGHVPPGRHPLCAHKVRHVVKGHHVTVKRPIFVAARGHPHQQGFHVRVAGNLHLALHHLAALAAQRLVERAELRDRHRQRQTLLVARPVEQPLGRAVDEGHAPLRIEPDDPRGNRREHGIEQAPPPLDLPRVVEQRLALPLQLARHLVEVAAKHGDLVIALFLADLNLKITGTDLLRRAG